MILLLIFRNFTGLTVSTEWMFVKGVGNYANGSDRGLFLSYSPIICLEVLTWTKINVGQNTQSPGC